MKTFQVAQKELKSLGMDSSESVPKFNTKTLGMLFVLGLAFSSICFYFKNDANSFTEYVNCAYIGSGVFVTGIDFLIFIFKQDELYKFLNRFEIIINRRMHHATSKAIFEDINRRSEKLSGILVLVSSEVVPFLSLLPTFIISFFNYFTTELGEEAFQFALPMWFPFNSKQPLGYLVALTLQGIAAFSLYYFTAVCVTVGFGTFLLAISMTKDIKDDLLLINKNAKSKKSLPQAVKQLNEFTRYHSNAKQLTHDFSDVFQPIFMVVFTWSTVTICTSMLLIQIDILQHEIDTTVLSYLYMSFGLVFIACELCERVSDAFDQIDEAIDQLDWYKYPANIKRILPMIMINAQEPIVIECFGSISCSRMVFKQVVNSGFSYFMVLRQFYK